ncbi:MAG: hypothetical protein JO092_10495 [Candidatus Eremiobacteraeota bacterium]|nr:hypothetical protein [Candidatus Eremiobacteraeota bacterium]
MFEGRVLYPWIASLLYPRRGFQAMIDVSRAAYIVTCCIIFVLLMRFSSAALASLCAAAFAAWPLFRIMGNAADTNMLALMLWSAIVLAIVLAVQKETWLPIAAFALLTIALAATRPVIYYPLFAALAVAAARRDRASYRVAAAAILIAFAYVAVSIFVRLPGFSEHLQWMHVRAEELNGSTTPSVMMWWIAACKEVFVAQLKLAIRLVYPAAIFLAAVVGIWLKRDTLASALLAGTVAASAVSLLADPVGWDFIWTVETPLAPILLIGIGLLLGYIFRRSSIGCTPE